MSIWDIRSKIKSYIRTRKGERVYFALLLILSTTLSFTLGRLSKIEDSREPIKLIEGSVNSAAAKDSIEELESVGDKEGLLVASKNGGKYHFPWCSGAQRIKEENKIWFQTAEEAREAGYGPAANCKGLK